MIDHLEGSRLTALTIWEPWVWCFTELGRKGRFIDNRDWKPIDEGVSLSKGDYVALHAGLTFQDSAVDFVKKRLSVTIPAADRFVKPGEFEALPPEQRLESYMLGAVAAVARFHDVFEEIPASSSQMHHHSSRMRLWKLSSLSLVAAWYGWQWKLRNQSNGLR